MYYLFSLYIYMKMTDGIFVSYIDAVSREDDDNVENVIDKDALFLEMFRDLVLYAILLFLPNIVLHWKSTKIMHLNISGAKHLQLNLLRKYLNYDEKTRIFVKDTEFMKCMTSDVHEVLNYGYWNFLYIIQQVGKLACMVIFLVGANYQRPEVAAMTILPLLLFPVLLGAFLYMRSRTILHYRTTMLDAECDVQAEVCAVSEAPPLVKAGDKIELVK